MATVAIDEVTKGKLEAIREETGASTNGEVIRNAIRVYMKDLARERREEAAEL